MQVTKENESWSYARCRLTPNDCTCQKTVIATIKAHESRWFPYDYIGLTVEYFDVPAVIDRMIAQYPDFLYVEVTDCASSEREEPRKYGSSQAYIKDVFIDATWRRAHHGQ